MTERIRELLEGAVSGVQPRITDPLPTVVGRARRAQVRVVAAGAMAIVVLTGGAVLGGQMITSRTPAESVAGLGSPPVPRVVNGTIVAGGVTVPVPHGWRVLQQGASAPCRELDDTALIAGPDQPSCLIAPLEVSGTARTASVGLGGLDIKGNLVVGPVPMVTLTGGEPGWLDALPKDAVATGRPDYGHNRLLLPWSKLSIVLRGGAAEQQRVIDSIRTRPGPEKRLVLPDTVRHAELTVRPNGSNRLSHGTIREPAKIDAVLRLLRQQRTVPQNKRACSTATDPTARLILDGPSADQPALTPSTGESLPEPGDGTTIVITLADDCREAVSSNGGRVSLTADTLAELHRLFGIPPR